MDSSWGVHFHSHLYGGGVGICLVFHKDANPTHQEIIISLCHNESFVLLDIHILKNEIGSL